MYGQKLHLPFDSFTTMAQTSWNRAVPEDRNWKCAPQSLNCILGRTTPLSVALFGAVTREPRKMNYTSFGMMCRPKIVVGATL